MFNVATYGFIVMCSRINRERTLCSKNTLQHSTFILWCKNKVAVMVVPFLLKYFQNEIKASEFKKKNGLVLWQHTYSTVLAMQDKVHCPRTLKYFKVLFAFISN